MGTYSNFQFFHVGLTQGIMSQSPVFHHGCIHGVSSKAIWNTGLVDSVVFSSEQLMNINALSNQKNGTNSLGCSLSRGDPTKSRTILP